MIGAEQTSIVSCYITRQMLTPGVMAPCRWSKVVQEEDTCTMSPPIVIESLPSSPTPSPSDVTLQVELLTKLFSITK